MKSTCWIYFRDHDPVAVFHGGTTSGTPVVTVEINAFEGGLDYQQKTAIIRDTTTLIRTAAGTAGPAVYVLFRDAPARNWGALGATTTLDELRTPDSSAKPI